MASCTLSTGTRTVIEALPSSPVATDDVTTNPPSERVRFRASCAARETESESGTSTVSVALTFCARSAPVAAAPDVA
jgi:hypothetical protein